MVRPRPHMTATGLRDQGTGPHSRRRRQCTRPTGCRTSAAAASSSRRHRRCTAMPAAVGLVVVLVLVALRCRTQTHTIMSAGRCLPRGSRPHPPASSSVHHTGCGETSGQSRRRHRCTGAHHHHTLMAPLIRHTGACTSSSCRAVAGGENRSPPCSSSRQCELLLVDTCVGGHRPRQHPTECRGGRRRQGILGLHHPARHTMVDWDRYQFITLASAVSCGIVQH